MILSYFESFKYVGHLYPLAFFRLFFGYRFVQMAIEKFEGDFLLKPKLAVMISENLVTAPAPAWYLSVVEDWILPQWQLLAYSLTYAELIIGIFLLFGFLIRPLSLLGFFMALNYFLFSDFQARELYLIWMALFLTFALFGAGRCLGIDYFFFKRNRGIWW